MPQNLHLATVVVDEDVEDFNGLILVKMEDGEELEDCGENVFAGDEKGDFFQELLSKIE